MPAREKNVCMRRYEAEKRICSFMHIFTFSPPSSESCERVRSGTKWSDDMEKFLFDVCGSMCDRQNIE